MLAGPHPNPFFTRTASFTSWGRDSIGIGGGDGRSSSSFSFSRRLDQQPFVAEGGEVQQQQQQHLLLPLLQQRPSRTAQAFDAVASAEAAAYEFTAIMADVDKTVENIAVRQSSSPSVTGCSGDGGAVGGGAGRVAGGRQTVEVGSSGSNSKENSPDNF